MPSWSVDGTVVEREPDPVAAREAEVTVLLQAHRHYDLDEVAGAARLVFDARGQVHGKHVERL